MANYLPGTNIPITFTDVDWGRKPYVSDDDYADQMRVVPEQAFATITDTSQADLKKPYLSDSYVEMVHLYDKSPYPDFPFNLTGRIRTGFDVEVDGCYWPG